MAIANTASLTTDLNVDPYYDDFDETKNYHRILFRPGRAVQGRELTQTQSIIQNQIDRFGEHIFTEGSIVFGMEQNYDDEYNYVKIRDNSANGSPVTPSSFLNTKVTGETSNVSALVVNSSDGSQANTPDTKTLYVKYLSSDANNASISFIDGEKLNSNTGLSANTLSSNSTGFGSSITVGEGIMFAKDHFIRVPEQTKIISKYSANSVSVRVGYIIDEDIIDSTEDSTLLDPARGAYNFSAPGADRLKLNPRLTTISANTTSADDFVDILTIDNGVVKEKVDKPLYSKIRDYVARRTYDESGNYIVEGLTVKLREHLKTSNNGGVFTSSQGGNTELLSVDVSPGTSYVLGYHNENLVTAHLPVRKGLDTESVEQLSIATNYGNYINVNELVGNWDLDGHDKVSLRNQPANSISNTDYSVTTAVGSEIGTARVRALDYVSGTKGTPEAKYRLYLYDVEMTGGSFSDVRSIYFNNSTISDAKADVILTSGNAVLEETGFNRSLFTIPAQNIKTIRDENGNIDTTFRFYKSFDVTIATDGTFSVSTGTSNEQFPYSTGLLNNTQKAEDFFVTINASSNTGNLTGTVSISSGANTISGSSTNFDTDINEGDRLKISDTGETFTVTSVSSSTSLDVLQTAGSTASSSNYTKEFEIGQILDFTGVGSDSNNRSIEVTSTTAASFNIEETLNSSISATVTTKLNRIDGREIRKIYRPDRFVQIDTSSNPANTVGPWNLGFSDVYQIKEVRKKNSGFTTDSEGIDVTSNFKLDTGQKDNIYSHGKLRKKPNSTINIVSGDHLLVKLDYFAHDLSQGVGYLSVDSYPVDDINPANTSAITTQEIPVYEASTGVNFSLRDVIDIRPRISDTSSDTFIVSGATVNPSSSTNISEPGGGLRYSVVNENYIVDLDYYLPRNDIVVVDGSGEFRTISGVPDLTPITPNEPEDSLTLAKLEIAPYPSLPSRLAKEYNRPELANKITPLRKERYRMQDIGTLEERINDLEYYTSLSLLENDTKTLSITDDSGNDRFKNGFLVDNFTGHNVGDVSDSDYNISIDTQEGEARPPFKLLNTDLNFVSGDSTDVTSTGDLITLKYNDLLSINQNFGTTTRNAAGLLYSWRGELILEPNQDFWTDTTQRPDLQVNFDNNADNWQQLANAWGTQWNDWQTNWTGRRSNTNRSGREIRTTTTTTRRQSRSGVRANVTPRTQTQNLGNRIVDLSIIPFMRSRNIQVTAQGMKPNTRVYAFFDDEDVNDYMTPTDSSFNITGNEGSELVTNSNGELYAIYRLPSNDEVRFPVGNKKLRLTDNPTNETGKGLVTTSAEAEYSARGTSQVSQETILSTRTAEIDFQNVTQRRTRRNTTTNTRTVNPPRRRIVDRGGGDGGDPIAQTFLIDENTINSNVAGAYATKIDLFFSTKDDNLPITVEIREVDPATQYVTNKIVPFSKVTLPPSSVNTSSDGSVATTFKFNSPIYLKSGTDYAYVVKPAGGNPNYNVFVARMGDTDIITGNRVVKNPYSGILFASANDKTWTSLQNEDMKFRLYLAEFTTTSGTAIFKNEDKDYYSIANVSSGFTITGEEVHGETTLNLGSNVSANIGEFASGVSSNANGEVTFNSGSTLRVKNVTIDNKYNNGETISLYFANGTPTGESATLSIQSTPTGKVDYYDPVTSANVELHLTNVSGAFTSNTFITGQSDGKNARIVSIDDIRVDVVDPLKGKIIPEGTTTQLSGKFASTKNTLQDSYKSLTDNDNNYTKTQRYILSRSNEINNIGGQKSAQLKMVLSSNQLFTSPAIDLKRSSLITVENLINNDSTGEDGSEGGNAKSKYITRTVTLADGQDAEDIKIYLGAYNPPSAGLEIYYKILNGEDSDSFEDINWNSMSLDTVNNTVSDSENSDDIKELEYSIPDSNMTGLNGEVQYTNSNGVTFTGFKKFKIKIVLLSTNPSNPPRIKDFRAIALSV